MAKTKFKDVPNQSKGILDDYAIRKNVATREGTVEKVPVNDSDIINKKFLDDNYYDQTESDSRYVNITGDTMTGNLNIFTDGSSLITLKAGLGNAAFIVQASSLNQNAEFRFKSNNTTYWKLGILGADVGDSGTQWRLWDNIGEKIIIEVTQGSQEDSIVINPTSISFNLGNADIDTIWFDDTSENVRVDAGLEVFKFSKGILKAITTKTNNYSVLQTDHTILLDGTSNTITATLPSSPLTGQIFIIKCINDTNTIDIARNGKNIDGVASDITLIRDEVVTLQYDGTGWYIL